MIPKTSTFYYLEGVRVKGFDFSEGKKVSCLATQFYIPYEKNTRVDLGMK